MRRRPARLLAYRTPSRMPLGPIQGTFLPWILKFRPPIRIQGTFLPWIPKFRPPAQSKAHFCLGSSKSGPISPIQGTFLPWIPKFRPPGPIQGTFLPWIRESRPIGPIQGTFLPWIPKFRPPIRIQGTFLPWILKFRPLGPIQGTFLPWIRKIPAARPHPRHIPAPDPHNPGRSAEAGRLPPIGRLQRAKKPSSADRNRTEEDFAPTFPRRQLGKTARTRIRPLPPRRRPARRGHASYAPRSP